MSNREQAELAILNGPDTPGRRWLLEQIRKKRQAEVAEIERRSQNQFKKLEIKEIKTGEPLQATPEWFDQENEECKKTEMRWTLPVEGAEEADNY